MIDGQQYQDQSIYFNQVNQSQAKSIQYQNNDINKVTSSYNCLTERSNYLGNTIQSAVQLNSQTANKNSKYYQQNQQLDVTPLRINQQEFKLYQKQTPNILPITQSLQAHGLKEHNIKKNNCQKFISANNIDQFNGSLAKKIKDQIQNGSKTTIKHHQSHSFSVTADKIKLFANDQNKINRQQNQENINTHKNQQHIQENKNEFLQSQQPNGIRLLNNNVLDQSKTTLNQSYSQNIIKNDKQQIVILGDNMFQDKQNCHYQTISQSNGNIQTDEQDKNVNCGIRLLNQDNQTKLQEHTTLNQQILQLRNLNQKISITPLSTQSLTQPQKLMRSTSSQQINDQNFLQRRQSQQLLPTQPISHRQIEKISQQQTGQFVQQPFLGLQRNPSMNSSQFSIPSSNFLNVNDMRSQSLSQSRNLISSFATNNQSIQNSSSMGNLQQKTIGSQQQKMFNNNQISFPEQQKIVSTQTFKNENKSQQKQEISCNKTLQQSQSQIIITQQQPMKQIFLPEQHQIISLENNKSDMYSYQNQQKQNNLSQQNSLIQTNQLHRQIQQLSRNSSTYSQGSITNNIEILPNQSQSQYDKKQQQDFVEKNSNQYNQLQQLKENYINQNKLQQITPILIKNDQFSNKTGSFYQYRPINQFEKQDQQQIYDQNAKQNQLNVEVKKIPKNLTFGGNQYEQSSSVYIQSELSPTFGQNQYNRGFLYQFKNLDTKQENSSQNIYHHEKISNEALLNISLQKPLKEFQQDIHKQNNEVMINNPPIQTLQSPASQQVVKCVDTYTILKNNNEILGEYNIERQNQKQTQQKSPQKIVNHINKETDDSQINLIDFQKNLTQQNKCTPPKNQTDEHLSNSVQYIAEQNIQNNLTPEVRKALVQISFNQHCDEMLNQIVQEKELRLRSKENTPRYVNKTNELCEQKNNFNNQENSNEEIMIKKSLYSDEFEKNKIDLQENTTQNQQYIFNSTNNIYYDLNFKNQIEDTIQDQQEEAVKRTQNLAFNDQNHNLCVVNSLQKQKDIPKFLKIEDLLRQQPQDRLKIELYKREDNQDLLYVKDAQFTFSNNQKNVQFDQIKTDLSIQNDQKYSEKEYESTNKAQVQCFNQRQEQNSENQKSDSKQVYGLSMCERIIDTDGEMSCEKRQQTLDSCDKKRFITLHQVKNEEQYQREQNLNSVDQFQKQSLILKKYSKFDSPDKLLEKINLSNQQIELSSQQNNLSSTKIKESSQKAQSSENKFSPSKQNLQKMEIPHKQNLTLQQQLNKNSEKLDSTVKINNNTQQKNININNLNIDILEKEVEQIQQIMSPGLFFTPKSQIENQGINFEPLQETKLIVLQQNIQKNIEKILPSIQESELKQITQSIYNSVFGLLRDKCLTEASSSQCSDNSSQKVQSQHVMNTQRQSFVSQQQNQIAKSLQDSKQLDAIFKKTTLSHEKLNINQMINQQKESNYSHDMVYTQGKDDIDSSPQILKNNSNKFKIEECEIQKSKQQVSKNFSNEEKELEISEKDNNTVYEKESNTFMIPTNHEEHEGEDGNYQSRRQSYDFKQLLMTQEFEDEEQQLSQQKGQTLQDKKWLDDIEDTFIDPKMFEKQNNYQIEDQEIFNIKQDFQQLKISETIPSFTQNLQKYGLSPIREIESTFDQIQQSNIIRNTYQDYQTTSPDEKRVSHQGNFDTQKSRSNFYTQRGIEEEEAQYEGEQNQLANNISNPETVSRSINNNLNTQNSQQSQLKQGLTKQQISKKIDLKKLELQQWEEKSKTLDMHEKQEQEKIFAQELTRREDIEKKRQQYYENGKQKSYIFLPLAQLEQRSSESQILYSVSPNHQNSSQASFNHSRQQSIQQIPKQQQCSIEDWDKVYQQSKEVTKINSITCSKSNLHSRKGSLNSIAGPLSAQNTHRVNRQSQNQKNQKQEKQEVVARNVAQEYLKKCQSKQRSQEVQQLQRIKSTLIANLKNTINTNKIIDQKLLRSKSNDNIVIKDLLKQKRK